MLKNSKKYIIATYFKKKEKEKNNQIKMDINDIINIIMQYKIMYIC